MGIRDLYEGIADSGERAAKVTAKVVDAVEALSKVSAPASFAPGAGGAVAPGGPLLIGTAQPRVGTGGGGGGGGSSVVGSPLIYSLSGGGPAMTKEDLELFAEKMELPSGGWVYVFAGYLYPGSGGVLSTISAGGGGGGASAGGGRDRGPGRGRGPTAPSGNQDRTPLSERLGRSSAGSSVESREAVDHLRGLRSDVQNLARAMQGDGGAGIRFGGGL